MSMNDMFGALLRAATIDHDTSRYIDPLTMPRRRLPCRTGVLMPPAAAEVIARIAERCAACACVRAML